MPFTRSPASLALPCEVEFPDRLRDGHSLRNEDHARRAMVAHEFTEMMRHRSLVVANEQSLAFRAKRQNLGIEFAFQCCGTRRLEVCGWFELPESGDDLLIQVGVGLQPQLHKWVAKSSRRACDIFAMSAYWFVLRHGGWHFGGKLAAHDPLYLQAMTACLSAIVVMQIANVFLCRSDRRVALHHPFAFAMLAFEELRKWFVRPSSSHRTSLTATAIASD